MADNQQSTGGAGGGNGGAGTGNAGDDSSQNNGGNSNTQPKVVPWEVHERMQTDLVKAKEKARELEARLGEVESKSLQEKNDYKSLWEREKADKEKLAKELNDQTNWVVSTQQFNAVKEIALAAGLRQEALSDLEDADMSDVKVEVTSSGRYIVSGAKEKVEQFKTKKPHWFSDTKPPKINAGGSSAGDTVPGKRLTPEDVRQAELDWKRGRKTEAQYKEIYIRYCKENPRPGRTIPGEPANQNK